MLSLLLLPVLRERFPDRGLVEGVPPAPLAKFPGIHPGIRSVSVYDDGDELTVCIDDLTHGHFAEYDDGLPEAERERRIVDAVVEFLDALFADRAAAAIIGGCCGLLLYGFQHQRMQDNPAAVYRHYEPELHRYAERLQAGEVRSVEGRGYAIPQFLIDHGARYVVKKGDCFVVIFGFMPTDAVPELWFSPNGFDPFPPDLEALKRGKGYYRWEQLSLQWGACHWDQ